MIGLFYVLYIIHAHNLYTQRGKKEVIKENVCESQLAGLSQVLRCVCVCVTHSRFCALAYITLRTGTAPSRFSSAATPAGY